MNTCFVVKNIKYGTYHTILRDGKPTIIGFSKLSQAKALTNLINDMHVKKELSFYLPKISSDFCVPKQMQISSLCKTVNLSCLDVLVYDEDNTYVLYPATCVETLDDGEFRFYLENKFMFD